MNKKLYIAFSYLLLPFAFFFLFIVALIARYLPTNNKLPRLVWGSDPIINNKYWSRAMRELGYLSETFTFDYYKTINEREDWDKILSENFKPMPMSVKVIIAFAWSLLRYDIFFMSFNGFFIGKTPLFNTQSFLFKLAKKKTVLIPYGSDYFSYARIRSTSLIHGLLMSYPHAAREQKKIEAQVNYWVRYADVVIPGTMGPDGAGRWDVLAPSSLCIDLTEWQISQKSSQADGLNGVVYVVHSPNHKGVKGSEFIIEAIRDLRKEGLSVELILLEKIKNFMLKNILNQKADILVEQLIATGHGFNAIEGMASGIPTISNLDNDDYVLPMKRWSHLRECPIVSATPENLVGVLRKLVTRPELRHQLGAAGRAYVEKYHGLDSAQYLFSNVIDYVYGRKESLINLYHPLLGEYPNRLPKIQHPLVNNRIVD